MVGKCDHLHFSSLVISILDIHNNGSSHLLQTKDILDIPILAQFIRSSRLKSATIQLTATLNANFSILITKLPKQKCCLC